MYPGQLHKPRGIKINHKKTLLKNTLKYSFRQTNEYSGLLTAVDYLSSENSTYTTGSNVVVDGGWTIW